MYNHKIKTSVFARAFGILGLKKLFLKHHNTFYIREKLFIIQCEKYLCCKYQVYKKIFFLVGATKSFVVDDWILPVLPCYT